MFPHSGVHLALKQHSALVHLQLCVCVCSYSHSPCRLLPLQELFVLQHTQWCGCGHLKRRPTPTEAATTRQCEARAPAEVAALRTAWHPRMYTSQAMLLLLLLGAVAAREGRILAGADALPKVQGPCKDRQGRWWRGLAS